VFASHLREGGDRPVIYDISTDEARLVAWRFLVERLQGLA
jgi:hypothetical protein